MSQTQDAFRPTQFLAPRYWPVWLGVAIVRSLPLLPYRFLLSAGRGIGSLMYRWMGRRRHIGAVNLKLCFPELVNAAREAI